LCLDLSTPYRTGNFSFSGVMHVASTDGGRRFHVPVAVVPIRGRQLQTSLGLMVMNWSCRCGLDELKVLK